MMELTELRCPKCKRLLMKTTGSCSDIPAYRDGGRIEIETKCGKCGHVVRFSVFSEKK